MVSSRMRNLRRLKLPLRLRYTRMLRCVASFEGTRVSGSRFCSLTWKYSLHCAGCDSAAARAGGASSS
eukprot:6097849-Pyramimonas_sp.AAC.1